VWLQRLARRLARREQTLQVGICRELVARCRELSRRAAELDRELALLVRAEAAPLLALPGCGVLTAAKLVGETAGAGRFGGEAKLAMHAGTAPLLPAAPSSVTA
jgi:transposase